MRQIEVNSFDLEFSGRSTGLVQAAAGGTSDFDITLDEELYLDGGEIITWGANKGDTIRYEIVAPNDTIVNTWVQKWGISTIDGQPHSIQVVYAGKIPNNFKLRVKYTSTGGAPVDLIINYRLHRKI